MCVETNGDEAAMAGCSLEDDALTRADIARAEVFLLLAAAAQRDPDADGRILCALDIIDILVCVVRRDGRSMILQPEDFGRTVAVRWLLVLAGESVLVVSL